nr:pancreas/duodenum homeobox protein 1 [Desulfobulbaceae bacterium]
MEKYSAIFSRDALDDLFPKDRSNQFFDALFGDASEGAYDIVLEFVGAPADNTLHFKLLLKQRPGKCLACNLTYGLPEVFSRHPILDIAGVAAKIATLIGHPTDQTEWKLGTTQSTSSELHSIPFTVRLH